MQQGLIADHTLSGRIFAHIPARPDRSSLAFGAEFAKDVIPFTSAPARLPDPDLPKPKATQPATIMQVVNVNTPVTVTGRHVSITEPIREYAVKKVQGLHLDYPRIIEAKVLLDVHKNYQHFAEVVLYCADHITIEADTTSEDMYASIDQTLSKIARRMRKYKTRMLKSHRPKKRPIRDLSEAVYSPEIPEERQEEPEPLIIHKESYRIRPLFVDEAIEDMEVTERPFIVFEDAKTHCIRVVFRRNDGDYGMIDIGEINHSASQNGG